MFLKFKKVLISIYFKFLEILNKDQKALQDFRFKKLIDHLLIFNKYQFERIAFQNHPMNSRM